MIGFLLGYSVGKSAVRSRSRREARPLGYEEFEFFVIMSALVVGAAWPVHLGYTLTKWGLHVAWAVVVATLVGLIALATGAGYILVGVVYAGIWLGILIDRGRRAEEAQYLQETTRLIDWENDDTGK